MLEADPAEVAVGESLQIDVWVEAGPNNPVDTVQVYLNFDPAKLQVLDVFGSGALEAELQANWDNDRGHIDYAAGTLVGTPVNAPFVLVSIEFEAVAATGTDGTGVAFAPLEAPRQTKAIRAGVNQTGGLTAVRVVVKP